MSKWVKDRKCCYLPVLTKNWLVLWDHPWQGSHKAFVNPQTGLEEWPASRQTKLSAPSTPFSPWWSNLKDCPSRTLVQYKPEIMYMCTVRFLWWAPSHYSDVLMSAMASQNIGVTIVYSTICSCADQRKHQSSASLAFVRGIHQRPMNFPHKRASNAENVSIWWRHHMVSMKLTCIVRDNFIGTWDFIYGINTSNKSMG